MNLRSLTAAFFLTTSGLAAQTVDSDSQRAIAAADDGWDAAYEIASGGDPVATDTLTWLRLRSGDGTFDEYRSFLADHADWPGLDRIRAQAERAIPDGYGAEALIAWFGENDPETGEGAVRLAQALIATGDSEAAEAILRDVWINYRLNSEGHDAMVEAFGDLLKPYHNARTDELLWRSRRSEATLMLPLLEPDRRAVINARIGYLSRSDDLAERIKAVPAALRDDVGLAYDRYSWLAGRGQRTDAITILLDRSTSRAALGEPFRWSGWRRVLARWEMREGRAERAYQLASRHYLDDGASYVDLEWLSGYIALTYLGDPERAQQHFENGLRAATTPISLGRMHYWLGRVHEVRNDAGAAATAYAAAAEHQTGFYGLLASEKIGRPLDPSLAGEEIVWQDAPVFDDPVVKAAFMLLAGGERGAAVTFFAHLGRELPPEQIGQIGAYLNAINEEYYTLLLGKVAVTRGHIIPTIYYPIHEMVQMDLPVDMELAMSIARRESEFNEGIGSPVGALGLMQVMPTTAEEVAGDLGLPYSRGRLTSDWRYNATLGASYLEYLTEEFGPTPVMIAAGYNAGPSRPKRWMDERGDPRLRQMDVVDWIEHIPFRETRNYVMRVTESIPVYRARLTGQTGNVQFTRLLLGEKPLLRPVARPADLVPDNPVAPDTVEATGLVPATAGPDVRPVARPRG